MPSSSVMPEVITSVGTHVSTRLPSESEAGRVVASVARETQRRRTALFHRPISPRTARARIVPPDVGKHWALVLGKIVH
jgi:hypothetical protein